MRHVPSRLITYEYIWKHEYSPHRYFVTYHGGIFGLSKLEYWTHGLGHWGVVVEGVYCVSSE